MNYLYASSLPGPLDKAIDDVTKRASVSPYQFNPSDVTSPTFSSQQRDPTPRTFNVSFTLPKAGQTSPKPSIEIQQNPSPPVSPVDSIGIDYQLSVQRQRAALNRDRYKKVRFCVFCQSSKQPEHVYRTHVLKDPEGRVVCPYLRSYTCPLCGASGDDAHTMKYCPLRQPTIVFT